MKDVQAILADLSKGDSTNPPVLGLNLRNLMKARNNGFPMEMYHETLEPIFAINEKQAEKLGQMGYVTHYIPRQFPKWIFRFNSDPKFALQLDPATRQPRVGSIEWVEQRLVKTQTQLDALKKERIPRNCGPWCEKLTDVEFPGEDGPHQPDHSPVPDPNGDLPPIKSRAKAA